MSFLKAYTDYAGRLTDAPPLFHTWVGLGMLSAALGNGCWVWAWGHRICPNLWVVLLADSGVLRKTTALNIGQGVLTEKLKDCAWPSEWSFEGLLDTMAARPAGTLFVREFKRFNSTLMRDYAGGTKELLVDCYDNPEWERRRTKTGGETEVHFPAPSILAATTIDWFEASLQRDDVGGGFLSRMFVIGAKERGEWKGLGATRSEADGLQRQSLGEHLERAREIMQGELDTSGIRDSFNDWLEGYEQSWRHTCGPELAGTIARTGANALKLTAILQADRDPSLVLSLDAFERARKLVEFANEEMAALIADGLALSPDAKERKRVLAAIQAAYPEALEHSAALKNLHLDASKLGRHVQTLVEADQVRIETVARGESRRTAKAYRWVNGASPA